MAPYQSLKLFLVETVGLSKAGFHFVLGFGVYFVVLKIFKVRVDSPKSLMAPFIFGVMMEAMDFRDALSYKLLIDWLDSIQDIAVTISLPVFIFIVSLILTKK